MKHRTRLLIAATILSAIFGGLAIPALAADKEKDDLRARFESRYPKIRKLKDEGKIGETTAGLVEAVKGSLPADEGALVDEENTDRKDLYDRIAKREGTTSDVVAARNAKRNFEKAQIGDWLKSASGKWTRKS